MDKRFMRRAIELAKLGEGHTHPNPLVGAVIVKNGKVIGEGYHERYGEPHAERNALKNAEEDVTGADMYVTLEPCCHHGKQPPCTDAIIESGITNVYVGSDDPNKLVGGKGISILRESGIHVETGILKEECDALNDVFFHYIQYKTPYVVMKYAMTLDGKIACDTGESKWVTGDKARENVQDLRNKLTGIMVGINTVINDDPLLNCRKENGVNPIRIICDTYLRIPEKCRIVETSNDIETYILTGNIDNREEKIKYLSQKGVGIIEVKKDKEDKHVDLCDAMQILGERGIDSILLEGGGMLNESALRAGIVNEIKVYISPKIFGGSGKYTPVRGTGVKTPKEAWHFKQTGYQLIGEDMLLSYKKNIDFV